MDSHPQCEVSPTSQRRQDRPFWGPLLVSERMVSCKEFWVHGLREDRGKPHPGDIQGKSRINLGHGFRLELPADQGRSLLGLW